MIDKVFLAQRGSQNVHVIGRRVFEHSMIEGKVEKDLEASNDRNQ